ncbi:MAG: bifunctional 2-polyprenyl-6-hydroxyphenol methylase/3-demethylubiquinol 3-O-methyltransferase UbiG, partial [Gammaproteobacteria bacterium]|nr:bifunctional 2-polyprenyl-6-hydroxyphenol methylase/3-demethylubiquinol 3-O-methyltransferase UbiG [Gammaproteobacteria bacterium]
LGAQVTGIDMGEKALGVAKLHRLESALDIDYQLTTAEEYAELHPAEFDVVTCLEMLEHVPDPGSVIQACQKMIKADGDVFFSTINRNPKAFLFAVVGAEYVLNLLPKGTHSYAKFIKPSGLNRWAMQAGLEVKDLTGMHYDPIARVYSLADGVDVNYLAHYRPVQS